jgi:hypothetical protein
MHVLPTIADQPENRPADLLPWNWRKSDINDAAA